MLIERHVASCPSGISSGEVPQTIQSISVCDAVKADSGSVSRNALVLRAPFLNLTLTSVVLASVDVMDNRVNEGFRNPEELSFTTVLDSSTEPLLLLSWLEYYSRGRDGHFLKGSDSVVTTQKHMECSSREVKYQQLDTMRCDDATVKRACRVLLLLLMPRRCAGLDDFATIWIRASNTTFWRGECELSRDH